MSNILWYISEILVNYYQGALETYFVFQFLNPKSKNNAKIFGIICALMIGTSITLLNMLSTFEGAASFLYFACLMSYSFVFFRDKPVKKVVASIIPLLWMFFVSSISLNLISSFFHITVPELVISRGVPRIVVLISIQLLFLFAIVISLKLFKYASEKFTFSDWIPIISVLLLSILLVSILHVISMDALEQQRSYINIAYLLILIINLLAFYVIRSLLEKNQKISQMDILKQQERYQKQYIENANIQYDAIRKIRHDIKNQLFTVYNLIIDNEIEKALEFITQNADVINKTDPIVKTDSQIVNAIINSSFTVATALGINATCLTVSDFSGIEEIDLCNLLSNALENALTACINSKSDTDKLICVEISKESNIYTFIIKNTIEKSVLESNKTLRTTKSNKRDHGLGTRIIADIATKYNGRSDFYEIDNMFCCQVILKIS